jgi:isocitrate/isopropylmalate dehydrogenase
MSEQRKFKIAIIPGDGIGKEVIQEGPVCVGACSRTIGR